MATIGSMVVSLGLDSNRFSSGVKSAQSSVSAFSASLTSSFGSVAGFATRLAAVGVGALGLKSAFDGLSAGFKGAADMESAQVAFGVLFKSTDKAKQVLAELSAFAASTPFELPELTTASRSLAAFGFDAAAIVPNLRMIGDIAAGTGQPVGELAELYGKARVQGRLFGEDINQLTGRGIPIIQELAKQFGVAESEVKKLVEQGKVGFPQLEQAFQTMTSEGGMFVGMMEEQSKTLSGLWSTLKDNVGASLRSVAEELIKAFDIKAVIADSSVYVAQFASWLTGTITVLVNLAKSTWEWMRALSPLAAVIAGVVAVMQTIVVVQRAIAAAQAVVLALSGPAGWAVLAAGATIGVIAYQAVGAQFDQIEASIYQAKNAAAEFNGEMANGGGPALAHVDIGQGALGRMEAAAKKRAEEAAVAKTAQTSIQDALKQTAKEAQKVNDQMAVFGARDEYQNLVKAQLEVARMPGIELISDEEKQKLIDAKTALFDLQDTAKAQQDMRSQDEADKKERKSRADALAESVETPAEKLQKRIAEINELKGELGEDKAAKLREVALKEAMEQEKALAEKGDDKPKVDGNKQTAALQAGTGQAFSAIAAAMRGRAADPQTKEQQKTNTLLATANRNLETIAKKEEPTVELFS